MDTQKLHQAIKLNDRIKQLKRALTSPKLFADELTVEKIEARDDYERPTVSIEGSCVSAEFLVAVNGLYIKHIEEQLSDLQAEFDRL